MIQSIFICALVVGTITAAPQFVTFKDGKIGVNFAGYNAEAGLGGLLTGNAAHGGLSASAGTPFGQRAAAGLDGSVNGDTAGRAYAGAQASDSVGASALLGGSTGTQQRGLIGAEAHSNGNSVTKTISSDPLAIGGSVQDSAVPVVPTDLPVRTVQKIKPPKKYTVTTLENPSIIGVKTIETRNFAAEPAEIANSEVVEIPTVTLVKSYHHPHHHTRHYTHIRPALRRYINKQIVYAPAPQLEQRFGGEEVEVKPVKTTYKTVQRVKSTSLVGEPAQSTGGEGQVIQKDVQVGPGFLNQWFNIPIGILQSIRDNLQPVGVRKQVTYTSAY